jgi:hypothetical protein
MAGGMMLMLESTLKINRLLMRRGAKATADSLRYAQGRSE